MSSFVHPFGFLTLGQSPRTDVEPTLRQILGDDISFAQAGALDGKSFGEILALAPESDETAIETRLADGTAVALSRPKLIPCLTIQAEKLALYCRHVVMLCSGEFPDLRRIGISLVEPVIILRGLIKTLAQKKVLGIVGPESDMPEAPRQWKPYAGDVVTASASPYGNKDLVIEAAMENEKQGAHVLLLDDMGFTLDHAAAVRSSVRIPVICAATATARLLGEMV